MDKQSPTEFEQSQVGAPDDAGAPEHLTVTISGVPAGATLSAGIDNGDGSWSLEAGDLHSLTITPPADLSEDFTLAVTATVSDTDVDAASITTILEVDVAGVADQAIPLDIAAALSDLDGSETLNLIILGVPEVAALSAGIDNGDGSGPLTIDELSDLSLTLLSDSSEDFTLAVSATGSEEDGGSGNDTAIGGAGNDMFIFSDGSGSDTFAGGEAWTDTIHLQGSDGGPIADGWTVDLSAGSVVESGESQLVLTEDSAGTVTLADGSQLSFEGVEKIDW